MPVMIPFVRSRMSLWLCKNDFPDDRCRGSYLGLEHNGSAIKPCFCFMLYSSDSGLWSLSVYLPSHRISTMQARLARAIGAVLSARNRRTKERAAFFPAQHLSSTPHRPLSHHPQHHRDGRT